MQQRLQGFDLRNDKIDTGPPFLSEASSCDAAAGNEPRDANQDWLTCNSRAMLHVRSLRYRLDPSMGESRHPEPRGNSGAQLSALLAVGAFVIRPTPASTSTAPASCISVTGSPKNTPPIRIVRIGPIELQMATIAGLIRFNA